MSALEVLTGRDRSVGSSMSKDEETRISRFQDWFVECRSYRKEIQRVRQWDEAWDFYMGKHYRVGDVVNTFMMAKVNYYAQLLDVMLPTITDSRPVMQAQAWVPENEGFARALDMALEWLWNECGMDAKYSEAWKLSLLFGTAFAKVYFDPVLRGGLGEIAIDIIPPHRLHIDPRCPTSNLDDARYIILEVPRDPYQLATRYPRLGVDEYAAEGGGLTDSGRPTGFRNTLNDSSGVPRLFIDNQTQPSDPDQGRKLAKVYECWARTKDYPQGQVETFLQTERGGFRMVKSPIDNPDPTGRFPFVALIDQAVPGSVWGKGEQDLLPVQRQVNALFSQLSDHCLFSSDPTRVIPRSVQLEEDDMRFPGQIYRPSTADEAKGIFDLPPAPLGREVMELLGMLIEAMKQISGIQDAIQGRRPEATVSGRAASVLVESAMNKMRAKARNGELFIEGIGKRVMSLMLEFYTERRILRTSDKRGAAMFHEILPSVEVDPAGDPGKFTLGHTGVGEDGSLHEALGEPTGSRRFQVTSYTGADENGEPTGQSSVSSLDPEIDVRIITGSDQPVSKAQKLQQMLDLHAAGLVDAQAVLDTIPWLDGGAILARMQDAQAKAAAAQGPPPPLEKSNTNINIPADKVSPEQATAIIQAARAATEGPLNPQAGQQPAQGAPPPPALNVGGPQA